MNGDPAPLMLVDSNVRGAGKGLLCDAVAVIVTGRPMARTPYVHKDDEMRKRITTVALSGDAIVLFDNVSGEFGCPSLEAALTGKVWEDRRLGVNEKIRAPLITTWFATGNNIALVGDSSRRTLHIRLDSTWERPEERDGFKHADLLEWVQLERPRLLAAALTILRAYFVADRPAMQVMPWGSYEAWTRIVRGAVLFAGLPDPADTREELMAFADTDAALQKALLSGLEELDQAGKGLTAVEVVKRVKDSPDSFSALRNAIVELRPGRNGELPDAKGLGNLFRKIRNRPFDGRCLRKSGQNRDGVAVWLVRRIVPSNPTTVHEASKTEDAGSAGSAGSSRGHEPRKYRDGVAGRDGISSGNGSGETPQTQQIPHSAASGDALPNRAGGAADA